MNNTIDHNFRAFQDLIFYIFKAKNCDHLFVACTFYAMIYIVLYIHCISHMRSILDSEFTSYSEINLCGKKHRSKWKMYNGNHIHVFPEITWNISKLKIGDFLIIVTSLLASTDNKQPENCLRVWKTGKHHLNKTKMWLLECYFADEMLFAYGKWF